jgi:O-antigen/teichoic acid export membrane protein
MTSTKDNEHFKPTDLSINIEKKSAKGGLIVFGAQFFKLFLQILSNVALARLLAPADFGLVAMVMVVSAFIVLFKDIGLSQATIQQEKINHEQVNTLFWVNVSFGFIVMLITWGLSPFIAQFYDDVRITDITIIFSLGLFISGLSVQHQALLRRQMRFKALSIIDVTSMGFGVITAIIFAMLGAGYWALVVLQLTTALITLIGVWLACSWKPSKPSFNSEAIPMLKFGGYMTGYGFVNYFARNLDNILIGWKHGAESLGNYSRAYSLLLLPIGQITAPLSAVAVPALSRLRDDTNRYCNFYYKTIKIIAYLTMPLITFMCIFSKEIVLIVLGEQWGNAANIFMYLSFAAFWQPVASTTGWVYVSLNKPRDMLYWGLFSAAIMSLFFIIGLPYGAEGVAISYSISMWLLIVPLFLYAFKNTPLNIHLLIETIKYPLLLSLIMGAVAYYTRLVFIDNSDLFIVLMGILACIFTLFLPYLFLAKFKHEINMLIQDFKTIFRK